jgi:biopolymer transport protein ExbB
MHWTSLFSAAALPNALGEFMSRGGPVLWWLALLLLIFWLVTMERILYLTLDFPKQQQEWLSQWRAKPDHHSWYAHKQRDLWLSQAHLGLYRHLHLLRLIIALFPMLGLLGTVTGMISVFDVLAQQGTSQPRMMAAGISMATLPTMAGMVAALSGVFSYSRLRAVVEKKEVHLEKLMRGRG